MTEPTEPSCPARACVRPLHRPDDFCCRPHWHALPRSLRTKIAKIKKDAPANLPVQLTKAQRIWDEREPPAIRHDARGTAPHSLP